METKKQHTEASVDSFEGLLTNFLKASHIEGDTAELTVNNVEISSDENRPPQLILDVQLGGSNYLFGLNKTNTRKISEKYNAPRELIGKVIEVRKALVQNPRTNKEVESLRITKVM